MAFPGKYQLLCPLKAGARPRNFLAFNKGVGGFLRLVVLRLLADDRVADDSLPSRLLGAARECAGFSHPYIAATYEPEVIDGRLYLATEFTLGATLAEVAEACRASNQRLPLGFLLRAARDAAYALHYAHTFVDALGRRQPVVHGALSDESLLVTFEGATKVVDFAHPREPARQGSVFASPEQVRGAELDGRADLFSLGAVLHSLVSGRRFQYAEVLGRAPSKAEFPPPSEVNPEASPQLDVCLMRALFPNRDSRYATALEFARDLERVAGPVLFAPEQSGAVVQHLFGARREQLKTLVDSEEGDVSTTVAVPPVSDEPGPPARRRSITIDAQPTLATAGPPEVGARTVQARRPKPGEADFPTSAGEFEPGTVPASPAPTPLGAEGFGGEAVQPTGRFDVVPGALFASPTRRMAAVAEPSPGSIEAASTTGQFRAALFDDVPATAAMPRPRVATGQAAPEEPAEPGSSLPGTEDPASDEPGEFSQDPTDSAASRFPAKRHPVLKLFLAVAALGGVALAAAWVLAPALVLQWYAAARTGLLDMTGRGDGSPPVVIAAADAGTGKAASPDDGVGTGAATPGDGAQAGKAALPDGGDAASPPDDRAAKLPSAAERADAGAVEPIGAHVVPATADSRDAGVVKVAAKTKAKAKKPGKKGSKRRH